MLDALKCDLKNLVGGNKYDEVFRRLKTNALRTDCRLYNDTIQVEGSFNSAERDGALKLISTEERIVNFNGISQALLWLIDEIEVSDLNDDFKNQFENHICIPPFHAATVDRFAQNDHFQLSFYDPPADAGKVRLFYLYGDAKQSLASLFKRLGREIGGFLLNWQEGAYDPGIKVVFESLKPTVHRHPMLYQINVVKELFARFFPRIDVKQRIQDRTIKDILDSPELKDFKPTDMVFILLTMDDKNWNSTTTPAVIKILIEKFLAADLPDSAPTFFFFFGIEYEKENADKKMEVKNAILERQYGGEVLDELEPVSTDDIEEWFSRYKKFMVEPGKEPKDMVQALFGDASAHDMNSIEMKLLKLIEMHNKKQVISTEHLE